MPPFRLEEPERRPTHGRKPKILYTKNAYSDGVKVEHWHELQEHNPIDVDPFCQGKVNYFVSHYHRLGTDKDGSYRTTTQDMLEQRFLTKKGSPKKRMGNFYTYCYGGQHDCVPGDKPNPCPDLCASDFSTTMQHSYQMPKPYVIQRLAFPKIPFMQNHKFRHEIPDLSDEKFYNEDFHAVTCQMRKHKGFRGVSFNPMTGEYTTVPK